MRKRLSKNFISGFGKKQHNKDLFPPSVCNHTKQFTQTLTYYSTFIHECIQLKSDLFFWRLTLTIVAVASAGQKLNIWHVIFFFLNTKYLYNIYINKYVFFSLSLSVLRMRRSMWDSIMDPFNSKVSSSVTVKFSQRFELYVQGKQFQLTVLIYVHNPSLCLDTGRCGCTRVLLKAHI